MSFSSLSAFVVASIVSTFVFAQLKQQLHRKDETETLKENKQEKIEIQEERIAFNFHFTRQCNYNCGFCFHTAKTSHVESEENCKKILSKLRQAGFKKVNFAGGEPFLEPKLLGALCKYAKEECRYESVSIISNGSKCKEEWFDKFGQFVDILGISCDSFDETINTKIGRGKGNHLQFVRNAARYAKKYQIQFKINTVVNAFNQHEDLSSFINDIMPNRWKIFQVLPLEGENIGENAKRNVEPFLINSDQFQDYILRNEKGLHESLKIKNIMKVEGNDVMQSSYILIDEYGCFLDSSSGGKVPTRSILAVDVEEAWKELLQQSNGKAFDAKSFFERDGDYRSDQSNGYCSWTTAKGSDVTRDIEDLARH